MAYVDAADLASNDQNKGASLVGLEGSGTVQDAIRFVTPEMFGAAADGSASGGTDDTAAINAADYHAGANGLAVLFTGEYHVTGQLLHSDNTVWWGEKATIWMGRTNSGGGNYYEEALIRSRTSSDWSTLAIDSADIIVPENVAVGCTLAGELAFRWTDDAIDYVVNPTTGVKSGAFMPVAYYLCDNLRAEKGVTFDCGWGAWTVTHYGDFCYWGADILGGQNRPIHSDGFHNVGGDYGFFDDPLLTGGDDACALGTIQFNLKGGRGWNGSYRAFSRLGSALKIGIFRVSTSATYANPLEGASFGHNLSIKWVQLGQSFNALCRFDTGENATVGGVFTSRAEAVSLISNNVIRVDGSDAANLGTPTALWSGESVTNSVPPGVSMRGGANNSISGTVRSPAKNIHLEGIGDGYTFDLYAPDTPNWIADAGSAHALLVRPLFERANGAQTGTVTRYSKGFTLDGEIAGGYTGGSNIRAQDVDGPITVTRRLLLSNVTASQYGFLSTGTQLTGLDSGHIIATPETGSTTSRAFGMVGTGCTFRVSELELHPAMEAVLVFGGAPMPFLRAYALSGRTATIAQRSSSNNGRQRPLSGWTE